MTRFIILFSFSFQGGPVKTNRREVSAPDAAMAVEFIRRTIPSSIRAWVDWDATNDLAEGLDVPCEFI